MKHQKTKHIDVLHIVHVCIAGVVFGLVLFFVVLDAFLSGAYSGQGLWGVSPNFQDYVPSLILPFGIYLFFLGASRKQSVWYMWLAILVMISTQFGMS